MRRLLLFRSWKPVERCLALVLLSGLALFGLSACDGNPGPVEPEVASAARVGSVGAAKVSVCHRTGGDQRFVRISVARPSLPAHRRHGDGLVGEEVPGEPGMVFDDDCQPVPREMPRTLAVGYQHTCAISASGVTYCWGNNEFGQLGNGTTSGSATPVAVEGGHTFVYITAGKHHTCALDPAGTAFCWGLNDGGQLGDGTTTNALSPVAVFGGQRFVQLAASNAMTPVGGHTCGLDPEGAAYCWGSNIEGELGNGSTDPSFTPVAVLGNHRFVQLTAGSSYTCGRTEQGAAFCWGGNWAGQLGIGGPNSVTIPTAVVGDHVFSELAAAAAGGIHTCGLDRSGTAFCWGWGVYGQRGDGTWTHGAYSPVPVLGGLTFDQIAASRGHTCALDTSGAAYCWGLNWAGGLGNGNTTNTSSPVAVLGGHSFSRLDLGLHHTCAEDLDGALFCWGGNDHGQLGDGTTNPSLTPRRTLPF